MIRIAQFSDLHYSEKNLAEADRCFGFAVDEAIRRGAEVAVISGDSTDHALDVHSPAVERLARQVRRLADHCPVLMLQGTFSHEPPGTLAIFRLLGGRYGVHVADRIGQAALRLDRTWLGTQGWRCLLYTSDAADERSSVDLGGCRIIKKKTHEQRQHVRTGSCWKPLR